MLSSKNLLLIGAADRNVGKTEFACSLIKQTSLEGRKVVGVKVTTVKDDNHGACPRGGQGCGVCSSLSENFCLTQESDYATSKDTSRMLRAGASAVYWLRVRDGALKDGASALLEKIESSFGKGIPVVCESNSLRTVLEPGLFFVLNRQSNSSIKKSCRTVEHHSDKKITLLSIEQGFDFDIKKISFINGGWYFKTDASCIILAGGKSQRMGEDKTKLMINGLPMIENVVKQLRPIFETIIISSNKGEELSYLNAPIIRDKTNGNGPLMGIYSCLMESETQKNFVIACDVPEININLIYRLLESSKQADVVIPRHNKGKIEPLFAVYDRNTLPSIAESLKTSKQIRAFFDKVKVHYLDTDSTFFNINTIDDYKNFTDNNKQGLL